MCVCVQSETLTSKREVWCELSLLERIKRNVLKWFGHVERMGEGRLVKRMYRANVEGNRREKETVQKMEG